VFPFSVSHYVCVGVLVWFQLALSSSSWWSLVSGVVLYSVPPTTHPCGVVLCGKSGGYWEGLFPLSEVEVLVLNSFLPKVVHRWGGSGECCVC
jgi:hypothetical protein